MHIIHVYKDYYPVLGGIENIIKILAESQAAAGHRVTVLACSVSRQTQRESLDGVEVIKAGRLATVASMPLSLSQPLILAGLRPDIVHLHSPYPLGEAANWLLGRAKATIIRYHSDVVRQKNLLRFYGPILRRVLARADRILVSTPPYVESSVWLQPVRDKCTIVPFGVDLNRFLPPRSAVNTPLHLLFVGRLRYYKGLDTLLQAMPHAPDAHLTIVGTGPMGNTLQQLTHTLNISERVTFAGEVADAELPRYYHNADVFVLPSNARSEAFGVVLIEAMASGLPCISTELGTGTSWIVQHAQTGLVVPPQDPAAMAQAINTLVADEPLRQRFAQASLDRARTMFSQEMMVNRVMAVYEEVLSH